MVKREVVGAHYGLRDWLAQRITAVVMAVYTLLILSIIAGLPRMDYWQWKVMWQAPVIRSATVLVLICLLLHTWIGVRNIFMDYIKDPATRLVLYVLTIGALVWYGIWLLQILWSV